METDEGVQYARLAAKLLATATRPVDVTPTPERRAMTVAAMELALQMRARRRRTTRLIFGSLGVTTLAALALALFRSWP